MSTENLNPTPSSPQDKEWEATMLSFAENTETGVTPAKTRKKLPIRRRTLTVILSSVGTVLLAVVLLVCMLTIPTAPTDTPDDSTNPSSPISTKPAIPLLNNAANPDNNVAGIQMQRVDIQNTNESFSVMLDSAKNAYVIEGYEDLTLSADMVITLRKHTETIEAAEQVEDEKASDLSSFGLDKPQATAVITYADGSTSRLRIGDMTPSETGFYGQFGDSDNVYIFASDSVAMFRFRAAAFISNVLIATPSVKSTDTNGVALLRDITFSGNAHPVPLTLRRSNHQDPEVFTYFTYLISAPYMRGTKDTTSNELGAFKGLKAQQALFLHPTADQKDKLGFNDPLIKISATMAVETEEDNNSDDSDASAPKVYYNSATYNLVVGSVNEEGNYIVMVDGIDAIYLVSKDEYGYLFDLNYRSAVNDFLFFNSITDISRIGFRMNGKTYEFHLSHHPEREEQDLQLTVKSGDKIYPTADFRKLYELMLGLARYGEPDEEPDGNVPLELYLYDNDGNLYLDAKYYESTGSLCIVETSEGEVFTTRWSDVSFFIQQVENYVNGRDVLTNT